MMRIYRHVVPLLFAAALLSCTEEKTTIDLSAVSLPEGGSVYTVAVLDGDERLDVVAPTPRGLFVHRNDSGAWRHVTPRWPAALPERQSAPLRTLGAAGNTLNFPHSQAFTAHQGRLWMVTGIPGPDGTHLLVSDTVGRTWSMVELPEAVERDEAADARAPLAAAHVRLLNFGERGLYVIASSRLWKLRAGPDGSLGEDLWQPISLEGVERSVDEARLALPTMLRHYLPATTTRPFELLTVLSDRLVIYRRSPDAESWQQVATLQGADRELIEIPNSDGVLMLTPEGLLRSTQAAAVWQPVSLPPLPQAQPASVSLEVLASTESEPVTVLLSLENGSIYRSTDLGENWREVRPADADHRAIVDFTRSKKRDRVWAATRGGGVLRSLDRGETWHQINDNLRATRVFDLGVDNNSGFLLGTDAGLFRLTGAPEGGQWQMLQDRSTTAIHVELDSGVLINGTANGAIVRLEPNGKTTTAEAAPFDHLESIVYRPMRFRGVNLPPRAIVEIYPRPDSQHVFAWSAQEGPLMSLDGGVSWTRMPLNPAFRSALEGSYLSNFTTDFGERMYLVTHPLSTNAPTQLWRSFNNGETWHAVSSFARGERRNGIFIARSAEYDPEVLFMAHRNRFAKSLDGGNSWRDIRGRWENGEILTYHIDHSTHWLAVDTRHVTNLLRVRETGEDTPEVDAYTLEWPADSRSRRDEVRHLSVHDNRVFLATTTGVLSGMLPDGQQRLPDGLAVLLTIVSILVLTTIGFIFLRWKT